MRLIIKATKIDLSKEIKNFIEKQLQTLEKFAKKFLKKGETEIKCWIEIGKTTAHHQKGPIFYAESQMNLLGRCIRSEVLHENLKSAIIEMREELERELKKEKEIAIAKVKRGARKAKRELKISVFAKKKEGKRVLEEGI